MCVRHLFIHKNLYLTAGNRFVAKESEYILTKNENDNIRIETETRTLRGLITNPDDLIATTTVRNLCLCRYIPILYDLILMIRYSCDKSPKFLLFIQRH